MPRTLLGIVAGMALGVAGALMQAGIVTAFVGAPMLILLANNRRMKRS
ncbi:hypothetical protein [Metarhizobium album]|nr:hypothetical protein [Rhizobium album]